MVESKVRYHVLFYDQRGHGSPGLLFTKSFIMANMVSIALVHWLPTFPTFCVGVVHVASVLNTCPRESSSGQSYKIICDNSHAFSQMQF